MQDLEENTVQEEQTEEKAMIDTFEETLKAVGSEIMFVRRAGGLSIKDVAARLRLQVEYLEAIEKGNLEKLPAPVYILGYVRSYANTLGVPSDAICRRLQVSLNNENIQQPYEQPFGKAVYSGNVGRTAVLAIVALMLVYGGWYIADSGSSKSPEPVTPVVNVAPVPEDASFDETLIDEPLADEASVDESRGGNDASKTGTLNVEADLNAVSDASVSDTSVSDTGVSDTSSQTAGVAVAHNRAPSRELVLKATATSWVEITRPDGRTVSAWLMNNGDEYTIPAGQDVYLTTGNAGGLQIDLGGDAPQVLGDWGEIIKELPLDRGLLAERY